MFNVWSSVLVGGEEEQTRSFCLTSLNIISWVGLHCVCTFSDLQLLKVWVLCLAAQMISVLNLFSFAFRTQPCAYETDLLFCVCGAWGMRSGMIQRRTKPCGTVLYTIFQGIVMVGGKRHLGILTLSCHIAMCQYVSNCMWKWIFAILKSLLFVNFIIPKIYKLRIKLWNFY